MTYPPPAINQKATLLDTLNGQVNTSAFEAHSFRDLVGEVKLWAWDMFIPGARAGYTANHVSLEIAISGGSLSLIFPRGSFSRDMLHSSGAYNSFWADASLEAHDL
jgi:hypothetical protein